MTSRNKSQGRYAGKFRGQHCRTHKVVGNKYKMDMPWSMFKLIYLPTKEAACKILCDQELKSLFWEAMRSCKIESNK